MHDSAQTSLALDDAVGNTHLAAQGRQEDNQLDGIDVVGDQNQRGLLILDQADNVVETVLDGVGLLAHILLLLALGDGGGLTVQTLLLLGLGLGAVLVEELEGLGGQVAVQGVGELSDRRRDLQAEVQNLLLALQADISGPLDEARQVALGLDVLADAEVARALLEQRVLHMTRLDANRLKGNACRRYLPWASWSRQPCPAGRARERLSYQTSEAVIEKEDQQLFFFFHQMLHLLEL